VGKPRTSSGISFNVASHLATTTLSEWEEYALASCSYLGARVLQWPHWTLVRLWGVKGYPRSVEFDENIFLVVEDNGFVVVGDDDGDGTFLSFGDRFTLDAGFHASIEVAGDEFLDVGSSDLLSLIEREFLVFADILNCECRPILLPKTD